MKTDTDNRSEQQAKAQVESIVEMVLAMSRDPDNERAREAIQEDPLSVQVRSGWYTPGHEAEKLKPEEFEILLCTGGPACRLIGELSQHCEPESVRVQHQDWGTPWTEYFPTSEEREAVLTYCRQFYFGE